MNAIRRMSLIALAMFAAHAQADDAIDAVFADLDSTSVPGCAAAIVQDGAVIFAKGFGLANLEYGIPITPDTVFHAASVSKQFTAFAIADLAAQGKLGLDDDVRRYVPELPDFGHTITIRHLIHHTSGLRDQWELLRLAGWRMEDVITTEDILELLSGQRELNFRPGDRHLYSNSGYTLLAEIVARVSGVSFANYCREAIFAPLGMTSTHIHDDHTRIVPNRAYSYVPSDGGFVNAPLQFSTHGATSLFTTINDLAKWLINLGTRAHKPDVVAALFQTTSLNTGEPLAYAFALEHSPYRGLDSWTHSGVDAGFRADLRWFPEQRFGTVILGNVADLKPEARALLLADARLGSALGPEEPEVLPAAEEPTTAAVVGKFEGVFAQPRTGEMRRIRESGGRIQITGDGGTVPVVAESETRLVSEPGPGAFAIVMRFDRTGAPDGFDLVRDGAETESYVAVADRDDSDAYLRGLAGRYYSAELDTACTVALRDGRLHLERRKYGSVSLGARYRDGFGYSWDFGSVALHFTRGASGGAHGAIDGFRLSTGRAWGLRFDRVE